MDAVTMKNEASASLETAIQENQKKAVKRAKNTPEALLKKAKELEAKAEALREKQEKRAAKNAEKAAKKEAREEKKNAREAKKAAEDKEKRYPAVCEKVQGFMEGHKNEQALRDAWSAWVELYEG